MVNDHLPPTATNAETKDWGAGEDEPDNGVVEFTAAECNSIQEYIWQIRDLLGLQNWDIFLAEKAAEDDTLASVHPTFGRHIAALFVNKNWWSYSPETQRNTILHELLHVLHNMQTDVVRVGYSGVLKKQTADSLWMMFSMHTELMVDHLANVLSDYFPLPSGPVEPEFYPKLSDVLADLND